MRTTRIRDKKTFNRDYLIEELKTSNLPFVGIDFVGFDLSGNLITPISSAKVIATIKDSGGVTDITAQPGEIWFESKSSLTALEETTLDNVLDNHDNAVKTQEQVDKEQDITDLTEIENIYGNWKTATDTQKDDLLKRMCRLMIRKN